MGTHVEFFWKLTPSQKGVMKRVEVPEDSLFWSVDLYDGAL